MNWEALGAIAETLGAIGVIATLLYLAQQIRSNTRSVRASTYQEMDRAIREVELLSAENPDVSRILFAGLSDFDSLAPEEKPRFGSLLNMMLRGFQNHEYQIQQGTLDAAIRESALHQLRLLCATPGFTTWWGRNNAYLYLPAFTKLVEQLISEHRSASSTEPAA